MPLEPLTAISSIDGRYRAIGSELTEHFSEFGLIRARLLVETEYLIALSEAGVIRKFSAEEKAILQQLPHISTEEATIVKKIEKEGYEGIPATNHDVKAIEYFIKLRLAKTSLKDISEWTHFALTSEDVNSVAHALALRTALQGVILPGLAQIQKTLLALAKENAATAMLARTHGQPASPTTFGKEIQVFESRIARQLAQLRERPILAKFGGATGNYNAHLVAAPDVDWRAFAKKFIAGLNAGYKIPVELNETTTQIEPHDTYAEMFDNLRRINTVLLDFSQDMWRYISDGWVTQKPKEGEVGSSAMPHKVNPIDFENAEGNFGVANAMLAALREHPEVIAEAIQSVLRREGVEVPYEKLKELTRGKQVTLEDFAAFIDGLDVKADVKKRLKALRPESYLGLAAPIAAREAYRESLGRRAPELFPTPVGVCPPPRVSHHPDPRSFGAASCR